MAIYELIPDHSDAAHRVYRLSSPVTLKEIGELVCANQQEVTAAVKKARDAQSAWAQTSFKQRAAHMLAMRDLILERQDEVLETVIRETGKTYSDAYAMEVFSACDSLYYYAKNTEGFLRPVRRKVAGLLSLVKRVKLVYQPLGVIGIITPWNGPFVLAVNQAVQALMAGNTVVIKGSEVTPYSTKLAETLFADSGLPDGVLQVLLGDGQTGADLLEAGVDKVSFTGSVATGKKVGQACGAKLMPCTLELGGKDAMIVCSDADIDRAVDGAVVGSCMNTGHYCCGTERIYVMADLYDEFVEKVTRKVKTLKQGQSHGAAEDVGAVFWDRQMEIIERHVDEAKAQGAEVLAGGSRNPDESGLYYLPTVVTGVDHSMTIMREETFGPVLCIMKVNSEEEALELANDSDYGLSGTVWSTNAEKAESLARRMHTGNVCLNDMTVTYGVPSAPFGGVKNSGVGLVNGDVGVRGYCQAKPIVIERRPKSAMQNAYPKTASQVEGMKKFASWLWGSTPGRVISAVLNRA